MHVDYLKLSFGQESCTLTYGTHEISKMPMGVERSQAPRPLPSGGTWVGDRRPWYGATTGDRTPHYIQIDLRGVRKAIDVIGYGTYADDDKDWRGCK
jgi:hypothetical protein